MRRALLLAAAAVADDALDWLPASLRRLGPVSRSERHWNDLKDFFRPGGPSENFKIAIDASCVEDDLSYDTRFRPPRPFSDRTMPWWRLGSYPVSYTHLTLPTKA